jgi:hypothetical protein
LLSQSSFLEPSGFSASQRCSSAGADFYDPLQELGWDEDNAGSVWPSLTFCTHLLQMHQAELAIDATPEGERLLIDLPHRISVARILFPARQHATLVRQLALQLAHKGAASPVRHTSQHNRAAPATPSPSLRHEAVVAVVPHHGFVARPQTFTKDN